MTKPDDIPQDVWETAVGWATAEAQMTAGRPVVAHAVARAIMAEREACARVSEERVPLWEELEAVAAAIRNRGATA